MDEELRKKLGITRGMERLIAEAKKYDELKKQIAPLSNFSFPSVASPEFKMPELQHIPTPKERNAYQSASVLMNAIAEEALNWKQRVPAGHRPAVLAMLYGGIQINVQTLSQVSFHGIRIEGTLEGSPCSMLAHQSTVQLLCYAEKINPDEHRNPIGFVWGENKVEV